MDVPILEMDDGATCHEDATLQNRKHRMVVVFNISNADLEMCDVRCATSDVRRVRTHQLSVSDYAVPGTCTCTM